MQYWVKSEVIKMLTTIFLRKVLNQDLIPTTLPSSFLSIDKTGIPILTRPSELPAILTRHKFFSLLNSQHNILLITPSILVCKLIHSPVWIQVNKSTLLTIVSLYSHQKSINNQAVQNTIPRNSCRLHYIPRKYF